MADAMAAKKYGAVYSLPLYNNYIYLPYCVAYRYIENCLGIIFLYLLKKNYVRN